MFAGTLLSVSVVLKLSGLPVSVHCHAYCSCKEVLNIKTILLHVCLHAHVYMCVLSRSEDNLSWFSPLILMCLHVKLAKEQLCWLVLSTWHKLESPERQELN